MARLTKSQQKVWDRLKYVPPLKREPWTYSASSTPPPPINGAIYYDTNASQMMLYDGTQWKAVV